MEHEGSLNKAILENYLHRLGKRLVGLSALIQVAEILEPKEQHMALETLGKQVEHEGQRVCELWRSLCSSCRTMTVREIYRADDGEKEVASE